MPYPLAESPERVTNDNDFLATGVIGLPRLNRAISEYPRHSRSDNQNQLAALQLVVDVLEQRIDDKALVNLFCQGSC